MGNRPSYSSCRRTSCDPSWGSDRGRSLLYAVQGAEGLPGPAAYAFKAGRFTVISRTFRIGMGEKADPRKARAMPAGSFILIAQSSPALQDPCIHSANGRPSRPGRPFAASAWKMSELLGRADGLDLQPRRGEEPLGRVSSLCGAGRQHCTDPPIQQHRQSRHQQFLPAQSPVPSLR